MRRGGRTIRAGLFLVALAAVFADMAAAGELAPLCGLSRLPRLSDSLLTAAPPRPRPALVRHTVGEKESLWIYDYTTEKNEQVSFTYRAVNERSYVLVDDRFWSTTDPRLVTPGDVARLSEVFERNAGPPPGLGRGIYDIETSAYAPVTPVGGDSMVYIAITEIKSTIGGGYIVGYVSPGDRYEHQYSNYRNLIILDAPPRTSDYQRERTLAHEFQHVIHSGTDAEEKRWVDEGISVYSQTLCGYEGSSGDSFFKNTNIGLFDEKTPPEVGDYDKAYLIMVYLADHYGLSLLGRIVRSPRHGIAGIDAALGGVGSADTFIGDVYPAWAVANVSAPDPVSRYAYRTYDPRQHYPPSFGAAGSLPIREQGSLVSFGLRYIRAATNPIAGEMTGSAEPAWIVTSVDEGESSAAPRPWYRVEAGTFRDCSFGNPWLIIAPLSVAGGTYSYTLDWHAPTDGLNPVIVARSPTGSEVPPYAVRIRGEFSNIDPGEPISVAVSSRRAGTLSRDVHILREGVQGRCGEAVVIADSSSAPLPANDTITVLVSDLVSRFGGALPSASASWQFSTGPGDNAPPLVTIGLLANPVITSYLTAVVYANEPLYPDRDGPVRLVVNGGTTVDLESQGSDGKKWVGKVSFFKTGRYDFVLHATDLAGNAPADPSVSYALIVGSGGTQRARLALDESGRTGEVVVAPGTVEAGGLVVARVDDGRVVFGPEAAVWKRPVRIGFPRAWAGDGTALQNEADGSLAPLASDEVSGLVWAAVEKPGTYALADVPARPVPFSLAQNRPNPFNPNTDIPVSVPASFERAALSIYAMSGQLVRRFDVPPGNSVVSWDGRDRNGRAAASGVYLAQLAAEADGRAVRRRTIRMVLSR